MNADVLAKPERMWRQVVDELELQMTKATFNTWLKDTQFEAVENGRFIISVRNDYALDWMQNRLAATVQRTFSAIHGDELGVDFVVAADEFGELPPPPPQHRVAVAVQPQLPGFPHLEQNWTMTPDFYFNVVLPEGTPSCAVVVGLVIVNTLGNRDKRGNAAEWWCGVTLGVWRKRSKIKNKTTLLQAIWDARFNGWIKRRSAGRSFDYALRWADEAVDFPAGKRPLMRRKNRG